MESKQKFLVLLRVNPSKAENFIAALMRLTEMPAEGVKLIASYNILGKWDCAVWFEASDNDSAVHFIGEKLRSIGGVTETITMPATLIKQYRM